MLFQLPLISGVVAGSIRDTLRLQDAVIKSNDVMAQKAIMNQILKQNHLEYVDSHSWKNLKKEPILKFEELQRIRQINKSIDEKYFAVLNCSNKSSILGNRCASDTVMSFNLL